MIPQHDEAHSQTNNMHSISTLQATHMSLPGGFCWTWVYTCVYTCAYMYAYAKIRTYTHEHAHIHVCIYVQTHVRILTCILLNVYKYACACGRMCMRRPTRLRFMLAPLHVDIYPRAMRTAGARGVHLRPNDTQVWLKYSVGVTWMWRKYDVSTA